eukprot:TRINITY_DN87988_c0_g1_i1.p2 TRINITY_DN87988_c0_g1~~TRINITY_DN87988_c0_g1_i1.p2  ORF type:complete len:105 (-),score=18.43 TRINITY_DN87988_c0_g1_i1:622-936(-)
MPDVEDLMQEWPEEIEDYLKIKTAAAKDAKRDNNAVNCLALSKIGLSLLEQAMISCAILDIPYYGNVVESLHVLITLFCEFRDNPHFTNTNEDSSPQRSNAGRQ